MRPILLALLLAAPAAASAETPYDRNYRADLAARDKGLAANQCWSWAAGFENPDLARPPILATTRGGYRIRIDRHQITITDPSGANKVEHWGDPHENLNGKHVKDWGGVAGWDGARRTVELGDGSKVTMEAGFAQGVVLRTSIYDGARNLQVDNCRNSIWHFSDDALDSVQREAQQHDGETATFRTDAATGVATYDHLGNEDASFQFIADPRPLGASGGTANPNNVRDFFDDPRLGHT